MHTGNYHHTSRWTQRISIALLMTGATVQSAQPTTLSDLPVYSANNVPANLMLMLSVEWPTGVVGAYTDTAIPLVYTDSSGVTQTIACNGQVSGRGVCYFAQMNYLGYFDYNKCYDYDSTTNFFRPVSISTSHVCTGHWSGNMLNWATMTKIDEFRQVLTGGHRYVDTASLTVLQRSRDTAQGVGFNYPPVKQLDTSHNVAPSTVVGDSTFSSSGTVYLRSNAGAIPNPIPNAELTNCTSPSAGSPCTVTDRGVFMQVSNNSCFLDNARNSTCNSAPSSNRVKQYYVRVAVCVSGMLESNCNSAHPSTDYPGAGTYPKPEGLIQQNYQRIRVGVAAYEHAYGDPQPNGMLRALLGDNGPTRYNGLGPRTSNANSEWDSVTGVFNVNPYPSDIVNSSAFVTGPLSKSGAINYLNQFGLVESTYEFSDTVSELYYVVLSYFKNRALAGAYTGSGFPVSSAEADGFPVMNTNLNDPVQYSCQANSIVAIGDSHTWKDSSVPDGYDFGTSGHAPLPAWPAQGSDPGLSVKTWLSKLGSLPLVEYTPAVTMNSAAGGDISQKFVAASTIDERDTYNLAGMAYYAHTQNMRPDLTDNIPGKDGSNVTIDTYTLDVMEPGAYDGSSSNPTYDPANLGSGHGPNQYWLAAKYGGFTVDSSQCTSQNPPTPCISIPKVQASGVVTVPTPENVLSWHTNSTSVVGKDMRPDNYFPGNRPDLIKSGLATIFNQVVSRRNLSAAAPGVTSSRVLVMAGSPFHSLTGIPVYQVTYVPGVWTGDIVGALDTSDPTTGALSTMMSWHAQAQVDMLTNPISTASTSFPQPWTTARRIVTFNTTTKVGVPFRFSNLSTTQQGNFPGDSSASAPLLSYLRGDRSNEGFKYRIRTHTLGDIVGSGAVLVQSALSQGFSDASNPGYSAFAASVANRAPIVYAGANDAMLHAFAAGFSTAAPDPNNPFADINGFPFGGTEQYAYVPSFAMSGPNGTPTVDGMPALANLGGVTTNQFNHHFYVDATPQIADVDFDWSCTTPGSACPRGSLPKWHTILVGGLGKGGKGIYALDITTPPAALDISSSATAEVNIAKNVLWEFTDVDLGFTYGRPVVAKTRKYGWVVLLTSGYNNTGTGSGNERGYLYVLSAQSGVMLEKLRTPARASGLGSPTPFTTDGADGTIEQVYAGDLLGSVWRFDLSQTGSYSDATLFASLKDNSGAGQPITTAPRVEVDVDLTGLGTRRWVFVGTGMFLDLSDINSTQQQTMYALRDGTATAFNTSGLPLARGTLLANTDLTNGISISDSASGWYYDLTIVAPPPSGATERIVVDPDAVSGLPIITWASFVPTSDPCQFAGQQYAVNYGTGQSVLLAPNGRVMPSLQFAQGLTSSEIVLLPPSGSGQAQYAVLGQPLTDTPVISMLKVPPPNPTVGRTNWREVLN